MSRAKLTCADYKKMRIRKRRKADKRYKRHLKLLADYPCGIWRTAYLNECENGKSYYKRVYRDKYSLERKKIFKKISNKRVRQYDGEIPGGKYRLCFDYWWTII